MPKTDEKDKQLLTLLQQNSHASVQQLAKETGLPPTTVHNRIKKLEQLGVIKHYTVELDWNKAGKPILAYILIAAEHILPTGGRVNIEDAAQEIRKLPEVEETAILTGGADLLVRIRAQDIATLNDLVVRKLRTIAGVDKTQTMIVLSSY